MAGNTHQYQMKRTSVAGRLANTTDPANTSYIPAGGLAVNFADRLVYTSDGSNLFVIGGGDANNANYLGGASLANIQSQIAGNSATAYSNAVANAAYQAGVAYSNAIAVAAADATSKAATAYANAVANAAALITGNAATAYSNAVSNTTYQVGVAYTNAVANTTYQSGVAYANAVSNATYQASTAYANAVAIAATDATSKAGIAYSNATSFASNATNITSGTLSATRLPYTLNQNVGSTDSPNFLNLTLAGNLSVGGSVTTISANNLAITDNMLYLNNGVLANVTGLTANGSTVVFAANNNFAPTWSVTTLSITPASYNNTYTITAANSTTFTVASTVTDAFVSGGTARGKSSSNPDIGFAAGYNDGTYHHTGFFRDHATGVWKVFDGYLPEPDNSVYIDQTNSSFNVANFMAGTLYAGNNSVSATVNSTFYSATSNNSTNFGGLSLTTVQSQITGNAATAYSNAVANAAYQAGVAYSNAIAVAAADATSKAATAYANAVANAAALYQTSAGLSANILTLAANSATYLGNSATTGANIASWVTGNSATAYSNATSYTDGRISTANSAITGNSSTAYTNAVNYVANSVTNGTIVAANAVYAQNAGTLSSVTLATLQSQITGNSATAYTNAVSNAAALYQTTAGLAANVATLAANSATYLGNSSGTIANIASWVTGNSATAYANAVAFAANASTINSGSIGVSYLPANIVFWSNTNTFTANQTFSANVTTANIYSSGTVNAASYTIGTSFVANTTQLTITTPVSVNGSTGTAGYVLTTNGATGSPYWAVASAGVNTAAQYTFTNTISFNSQVNLGVNNTKLTFTANGSAAGNLSYFILQNDNNFVLYNTATDGSSRPIFATYTNSNTSPLNVIVPLKVSSAIQDGAGSNGVSGYVLTSNGTATNWAPTIQPRIVTTSSGATWTVNTDITDIGVYTGSGNGSGALTIAFTGTPSNGQKVTLKIHGTSAFTLTYGGSAGWSFSSDLYQPSSTSPYTDYQGFIYDSSLSKWCLLSLNRGFL